MAHHPIRRKLTAALMGALVVPAMTVTPSALASQFTAQYPVSYEVPSEVHASAVDSPTDSTPSISQTIKSERLRRDRDVRGSGPPGDPAGSNDLMVDVVVLLKKQPATPDNATERANVSTQDSLLKDWAVKYGVKVDRQFGYLLNGFSAQMPASAMSALANEPQVASVRRERVYRPLEDTARNVHGAPTAYQHFDADGRGAVIAVIDSGIDPTHPDMRLDDGICAQSKITEISDKGNFTCKIPAGYNYADENYNVTDTTVFQHGMHVAGIAAANGSAGDVPEDVSVNGRIDGIAPNAQLLALKVFSNDGEAKAYDSDVILAIEDAVKLGADVINLSLGSVNGQNDPSAGAFRAIAKASEAGVLTVVAAGNSGLNFSENDDIGDIFGRYDDGTISSPATQGEAFAVASLDNVDGALGPVPDDALHPSDFTSWGPTPGLDFAPQIAGIGGDVYSTSGADGYQTHSGTSMASPNVAGSSALVIAHLRSEYANMSATERMEAAQLALMNTAQVPAHTDGGQTVAYSPRQIGAGLARPDLALATSVFADVDGEGAIALKEISEPREVTVHLTNRGNEDRSFTIGEQQAIRETNGVGENTTTIPANDTVEASVSQVSVPAGASAQVTFTITPDTSREGFMGGWLHLSASDAGQPDLAIPYLGFVGDWNAENTITAPGEPWGPGNTHATRLTTKSYGTFSEDLAVADDEMGYMSPNGDDEWDVVIPAVILMRNAFEIRYDLLKADGTFLKTLGIEQDIPRTTTTDIQATSGGKIAYKPDTGAFDGRLYDPATGQFYQAPDGHYIYRVKTRAYPGAAWQDVDMPFGIDTAGPTVEIGDVVNEKLTITITDEGSFIPDDPEVWTKDDRYFDVTRIDDTHWEIEVPAAEPIDYLIVQVMDAAQNQTTKTKVFTADVMILPQLAAMNDPGVILFENSDPILDGSLFVEAYLSDAVARVEVAGADVEFSNNYFVTQVPLQVGPQSFDIVAYDDAGNELQRSTFNPNYDPVKPEITLSTPVLNADGEVEIPSSGQVTIEGTMSDNRADADLSLIIISGSVYESIPVNADGSFSYTYTPDDDANLFTLVAQDGHEWDANMALLDYYFAGRNSPFGDNWTGPDFNLECQNSGALCFIPASSTTPNADGTVTVTGKTYSKISSFTIQPTSVMGEDGEYIDFDPIVIEAADDGTFSVDLPMVTGVNDFREIVIDGDGKTRIDRSVKFYFDITAPTIDFTEPILIGGTLYTNKDEVTFAGTAEDDGWGYYLTLNDSTVLEIYYRWGLGPESNHRGFSQSVLVKDGDKIYVRFADIDGNALTAFIPVVVDKVAPEVTFDHVTDGEVVRDSRDITVSTTDKHLASLKVTLNGDVLSEQHTTLSSQGVEVEDVLVKPTPISGQPDHGNGHDTNALTSPSATSVATTADTATDSASDAQTAIQRRAQANSVAHGTQTGNAETMLKYAVATKDLPAGLYSLTAESADLAGNVTMETRTFMIDAPASIEGPDATEMTITRDQLSDQHQLKADLWANYGIKDDGVASADGTDPAGTESYDWAPGTIVAPGANEVELIYTDANGHAVKRTVAVTVFLKDVTLSDGDVTATGKLRADDHITAAVTDRADGSKSLKISHDEKFADNAVVIALPGKEGTRVYVRNADGTMEELSPEFADGKIIFAGSTTGSYVLVPPAVKEKPTADTPDKPGPGEPDDPGRSVSPGHGSLSNTGSNAKIMGIGAVVLLILGIGTVIFTRRKKE